MKSDLLLLIFQMYLTCYMFYEIKPLQHFFLHKSGFLQCSCDSSASLYVCASSTPLQQRLCLLPNGLIEPNTDSLRNGMEGAPGGSLCDIPSSLPSQLLLRFDWTKFSLPHSHALTLSTFIYFKGRFFLFFDSATTVFQFNLF